MPEVRTVQNDMIDRICFDQFGFTAGVVEQTLALNPEIKDYGPTLPSGLLIQLPEPPQQTATDMINLWD